jgi:hypothetical protein
MLVKKLLKRPAIASGVSAEFIPSEIKAGIVFEILLFLDLI